MLISHDLVEGYILSMPNVSLDYPFGDDVEVYKNGDKMFALVLKNKLPVNLSLRCDPKLATVLRERYETVHEGRNLNKKHWNTIILTGQLSWEEVQDLIRHSYILSSSQ